MFCTCLPSSNIQFALKECFMETTYDVIMTSSVLNLGHVLSILVMSCTYLPSFNIQFLWEVSLLKTTYDIIMTSSVTNLGHVFSILVMSCTYLPSFNFQHVWEVSFLKTTLWRHYDVIITKVRLCIFNSGDVLYLSTKFQYPTRMGSKLFKNDLMTSLWSHQYQI